MVKSSVSVSNSLKTLTSFIWSFFNSRPILSSIDDDRQNSEVYRYELWSEYSFTLHQFNGLVQSDNVSYSSSLGSAFLLYLTMEDWNKVYLWNEHLSQNVCRPVFFFESTGIAAPNWISWLKLISLFSTCQLLSLTRAS